MRKVPSIAPDLHIQVVKYWFRKLYMPWCLQKYIQCRFPLGCPGQEEERGEWNNIVVELRTGLGFCHLGPTVIIISLCCSFMFHVCPPVCMPVLLPIHPSSCLPPTICLCVCAQSLPECLCRTAQTWLSLSRLLCPHLCWLSPSDCYYPSYCLSSDCQALLALPLTGANDDGEAHMSFVLRGSLENMETRKARLPPIVTKLTIKCWREIIKLDHYTCYKEHTNNPAKTCVPLLHYPWFSVLTLVLSIISVSCSNYAFCTCLLLLGFHFCGAQRLETA